ncbi:MAG: hypothetical protein IJQ66_04905 [Clostridia bacterium]|nr:hypothetical protein [Clostridia bacterium]
MTELNLTAANKQEELVLAYLQENASQTLADKINNGTPFEKDGKPLRNKKTLSGFMKYACEEARKLAEKGANSACIDSDTVFGWAIHYFEEDSIEGTLYTIDGEEYKPVPKQTKSVSKPPVVKKPEPPKEKQFTIFDMAEEAEEKTDDETEDELPTQEEIDEIMTEIAEEKRKEEKPKGSPLYQQYIELQNRYPDCIVAYRIGDFYEIFGDSAVTVSKVLDLTLTGRDCGLESRVPMVGFPYHVSDNYIAKLVEKGYKVAVAETLSDIRKFEDEREIDEETGEILSEEEMQAFDGDIEEPSDLLAEEETELAKHFDSDVAFELADLLGNTFTVG